MNSIVLTGGGTAGHVIPNLALLPELRKKFQKIYYIGSNGMEKELLKNYPSVTFFSIPTVKLKRGLYWENICIPWKLWQSIRYAKEVLQELQPAVIFSKGGYVALPVILAGSRLNIPCITHESDLTPGLANRIMARYCASVFTAFDSTAQQFGKKGKCTGNPIRALSYEKALAMQQFPFQGDRPIVLIFGGSMGAKSINELVWQNLNRLTELYDVIHITGKGNQSGKKDPHYFEMEFCQNMKIPYACSDVVVCRAGANTIFELLSLQKPAVLLPLSAKASRGDQLKNAQYCHQHDIASVIYEENLTMDALLFEIAYLLKNRETVMANMSGFVPDSPNRYICKNIVEIATGKI